MTLEELGKITLKKPVSGRVVKRLLDKGYLPNLLEYEIGDDYYDLLDKWKLTFVGLHTHKYAPMRTAPIDTLTDYFKRHPQCEDFTRLGIERIFSILKANAKKGICQNTLHQYGKDFKSVLNELRYDVELPYNGFCKALTLKKEDSQFVYLTEAEIERLDKYVPQNRAEAYAKRLFMISCYTGCRHSDAMRLNMSHVTNGTLSFVTQKTKTSVSMKMKPALRKYLEQEQEGDYKGKILPALKNMCKAVRISSVVTLYQRGREITKPKWFFVSPHTARRSFATNLHLRGADINTIKYLMGHSDISITQGYICDVRDLNSYAERFFD